MKQPVMNEDNVAIRLKGFIDSIGLTSTQFADACGIPRPSLSQLLSGRNKKISDILVGQIHSAFPQLSVLWLLFGEGDMLVSSAKDNADEMAYEEAGEEEKIDKDNSAIRLSPSNLTNKREEQGRNIGENALTLLELEKTIKEKDDLIEQLRSEIEDMRKKPRKVSQITVYYDDSTFETFYPQQTLTRGR